MGIIYALAILMTTSLFLAAAIQRRAEDVFPSSVFMVIAVLFPFYCMDLLKFGRYLVYVICIAVIALSAYRIHKQEKNVVSSVLQTVTPGICVFTGLCAFYFFYTRGRLIGLWDETRLWGAVPKALHATEALQLGEDALVYKLMQPYPPAMPLLVYFMTALKSSFAEGYVFAVYAIFFSTMLLPSLSGLKWKQWYLYVPLGVLFVYFPCLVTSHGGDFGWFYNSLFIDPILGVLAGYVFYLAATKPFSSIFDTVRFGAALLILTIIKDSGALFAMLAGCAAVISACTKSRERVSLKTWVLRSVQAFLPVAAGYGLWKYILHVYQVRSNEQAFIHRLPPLEAFTALWEKLTTMPMVIMEDPLLAGQLSLTYIPVLAILGLISAATVKRSEKISGMDFRVTWAAMLLSNLLFLAGYVLAFHASLPSFQRYVSTTLISLATFALLHGLPVIIGKAAVVFRKETWMRAVCAAFAAVILMGSAAMTVDTWIEKKWNMNYALVPSRAAAATLQEKILEGSTGDPVPVYVLSGENPTGNSLAHQRIYLELLGSNLCVRNFWSDSNMHGVGAAPETWTAEELQLAGQKWSDKLQTGGYAYIYVLSLNDYTAGILAEYGISQAAVGDVYAVQWTVGQLVLEIV